MRRKGLVKRSQKAMQSDPIDLFVQGWLDCRGRRRLDAMCGFHSTHTTLPQTKMQQSCLKKNQKL
jgi:hypothetical protein